MTSQLIHKLMSFRGSARNIIGQIIEVQNLINVYHLLLLMNEVPNEESFRHVNATKSYLYFGCFAGDAVFFFFFF